ncbi:MAG: 2-oxo acid dehydrogenase subunit E2 [Bacteroidota bacterium]|nr:2-oxo acid dehydrogenase subunit E2 [Bacteroidota bacterium]
MIKEVKLPEVSDNVETGDVLKVLVNVGDKVEIDQPLVELETEKATFEVPSTESGIVKEVNVKQGDIIKIGAVIITVETNGDDEKKEDKSDEKKEDKSDEKKEDKSDEMKEDKSDEKKEKDEKSDEEKDEKKDEKSDEKKEDKSDEKKEDKSDEKKEKDDKSDEKKEDKSEKKDEKSDEKKDEKSDEKKDEKSDEKKEDKSEKKDEKSDEKKEEKSDEKKEEKSDEKKDKSDETKEFIANKTSAPASPSVRRLARELGVDINLITSSGDGEKITEDDVKKYVKTRLSSDSSSGISIAQRPLPDFKKWGDIEIVSMTKIRTITAEAMTYAWTTIPMVTQFDKADITKLEEFRKKNIKGVENAGGHLTITSILVKVCEAALKNFPQFNSSIDLEKKEVILKKYFNIGVAVDTDRGLLVPVVKNIDKKNITEISKELNELAEKARNKKITPDEMEGGNFTISNLGGIGGTNFTPIVYAPQVVILGVSRGSNEAVYNNAKFDPAFMLPLSLTYDHRIIDGADAARFLRWICEALENPMMMIL